MPGVSRKKNVTIREVARIAGVSIGTVSRALKGQPGLSAQTRAEVIKVAQEQGYDVSKLRSDKPRRMLLIYNRLIGSLASNQFYSHVLHGAESACREADVMLSLLSLTPSDDIVTQVRRHEPDAVLVLGYFDPECLDAIRRCELPLVLTDHYAPGLCCINDDNLHGAWQATRHLLDNGARRPAGIFGPPTHHTVALRAKGFRRALFEDKLLADPDLEVTLDPSLEYVESGREAMRRLLALPERPDAVFVYNDMTALAAIEACEAAGLRVPQDIRFIGYDDIPAAAHSNPSLSTIRVDKEALGYAAAMALVEHRTEAGDTLLPVELVVRDSSQPRKAEKLRKR